MIALEEPHGERIPAFADALRRGWAPYGRDVAADWLAAIAADPAGWLRAHLDPRGTVALPDGRVVPKLPSRRAPRGRPPPRRSPFRATG